MAFVKDDAIAASYDVCVVGGGPAGIAAALRCHAAGLRVLLLEAGGRTVTPGRPDVNATEVLHADHHDPYELTGAAALGGSSHWWGGRCVPLDACDLPLWPIAAEELERYWQQAGAFLGGKGISETPPPPAFAGMTRFDCVRDETWGPELNMARRWADALRATDGPDVWLNARVVDFVVRGDALAGVEAQAASGTRQVGARHVILACGGLATVRLLMLMDARHPGLFAAGEELGKGYMGHLTGSIAELAFRDPQDARAFFFRSPEPGVTARRRFRPTCDAVRREGCLNTAFWLENGSAEMAEHGSAVSSAKFVAAYLVGAIKSGGRGFSLARLRPHLANIRANPWAAIRGLAGIAVLLASARLSGRHPRPRELTPVRPGAWQLSYHAEQVPRAVNRLALSDQRDAIGLPRLRVDFRFTAEDVDAVMRAHELLDEDLRQCGAGELVFAGSRAECLELIQRQARDGYHQMGGATMGADGSGFVDSECRVRGVANLWTAAGSAFPSGSQANPTLTIVALALRVADTIAGTRSGAAPDRAPVSTP